jgi:formate hydrogenlyase transcriptional activator
MYTFIEYDANYIFHVLEKTHWKVSGKNSAAEILGLNRSALRTRMRKFHIRKT